MWIISNLVETKMDFLSEKFLLLVKTADIVSGGAWGRRPHTLSEPALLVSYWCDTVTGVLEDGGLLYGRVS